MTSPITFINPNLILQANDMFTTGVVYLPVSLAYFAAAVDRAGFPIEVIDAFGEQPNQWWRQDGFIFRGLTPAEVCARIDPGSPAVVLYAINTTAHRSLIGLVQAVHQQAPTRPIIVMENSQAVTAYSLRRLQGELHDAGATYILTGEPEQRGVELLQALARGASPSEISAIDGIGLRERGMIRYSPPARKIADLDGLPFAAWERFPLAGYWGLHYAHGPMTESRYVSLLTSRGCPYPCKFCVIPETNDVRWRARTAVSVVDEMAHFQEKLGVSEFHIEDVDPTVNDDRTRAICEEILRRSLKVSWKLCAGTKSETIRSEATLEQMAQAGCSYISISPESGSPRVMKRIGKPFKLDHAVKLIRKMNQLGIRSQACFVLGFPGEEDSDRELSRALVRDLTREGLDEIAVFIITPMPGAEIFDQFTGYSDYSQLNFSPVWRSDYAELNRFRLRLYREFFLTKMRYHPLKLARQPLNFVRRRFETKMEMVPYRAAATYFMTKRWLGHRVAGSESA